MEDKTDNRSIKSKLNMDKARLKRLDNLKKAREAKELKKIKREADETDSLSDSSDDEDNIIYIKKSEKKAKDIKPKQVPKAEPKKAIIKNDSDDEMVEHVPIKRRKNEDIDTMYDEIKKMSKVISKLNEERKIKKMIKNVKEEDTPKPVIKEVVPPPRMSEYEQMLRNGFLKNL